MISQKIKQVWTPDISRFNMHMNAECIDGVNNKES